MKALVSIIIPAYNSVGSLANAIRSALAQTWPYKEIIVVDDGSTDSTAKLARRFEPAGVIVLSRANGGMCAAVNTGMTVARGDYIQELDADDILAPDKIERQLAALRPGDSSRVLLSSAWAPFYYRTCTARFVNNPLCADLAPADWLVRKLTHNAFLQNATWLVSRQLAEAAGPWDASLHYDQDGEYFARVLLASEGTRFVPGTGVYYRANTLNSVSYIGHSDRKKESLLRSMKLHIQYLQSLEQTERVRTACLTYLQTWYLAFYPDRPDLVLELHQLAASMQGSLTVPSLGKKYEWIVPLLGWNNARRAQVLLPRMKSAFLRRCDRMMLGLDSGVLFGKQSRQHAQPNLHCEKPRTVRL